MSRPLADPQSRKSKADREAQGNAVAGAYLASLGMSQDAIAFMTEKGPDDFNQLTPVTAAAYGVQAFY
jgi:hypothetical protein